MSTPATFPESPVPESLTGSSSSQMTGQRETAELLLRVLSQSDSPISVAQVLKLIPKSVKIKPDVCEQILLHEAAQKRIFEYPKVRNKPQFAVRSPEEFARVLILRKLGGCALTQTEALKAVSGKAFEGLTKRDREQIFSNLIAEEFVFECPQFIGERKSTRPKYSSRQPDPAEYLKDAIRKVAATLGLTPDEAFKSALICAERELRELEDDRVGDHQPVGDHQSLVAEPATDTAAQDERLLEAMRMINPKVDSGDMVDITHLRKELDAHMPGSDFDQAVLDAVYRRRFAIHRFDRPDLISVEQRALLLRDEQGQYYNTISLWRN